MPKCDICARELNPELDLIFNEYNEIFQEPCYCGVLELIKDLKDNSFIEEAFKKIFPEYTELPEGHGLLELQKLLEKKFNENGTNNT